MPSVSMGSWRTDSVKVNFTEGKTLGVVVDQDYYPFDDGENIVYELNDQMGRDRRIVLKNGSKVNFEAWKLLREERIQNIFEQMDPLYGELFQYAVSDYPELKQLYLKVGTTEEYKVLKYTGGFFRKPDENNPAPQVIVGKEGNYKYKELLSTRRISAQLAARDLGVDISVMDDHPEILGAFIFAHELGHGHDFLSRFSRSSKPMEDIATEWEKNRKEEMSKLPVPGKNPVVVSYELEEGALKPFYEKYQEYYNKVLGIFSPIDLSREQEKRYHEMSTESYADKFSANLLKKYWKELGFGEYS